MSAEIIRQIETVLGEENSAIILSDKLFAADGLFHKLASDKDERKNLVKSPLFRRAQKRLRELQHRDMPEFSRIITEGKIGEFVLKAERAEMG